MLPDKANGALASRFATHDALTVAPELLIDLAVENSQLRTALAFAEGLSERRELITQEIKHRMGNLLAVVQAIARKTFGDADAALVGQFNARLRALANAQTLLIDSETHPADLADVVRAALTAHRSSNDRWKLAGPAIALNGRRAHALTLALHELATNAFKYGAMSVEAGHVELTWSVTDDRLSFCWREFGGPQVTAPERRGFGSSLITQHLGSAFAGAVELSFDTTGIICRLVAPLRPE